MPNAETDMQTMSNGPTGPLAEPYRRWLECLDGSYGGSGGRDNSNSISSQFQQITHNHGLYTFLLGEEKIAGNTVSSRDVVSLAAHSLIAANFWPQQLLRVRKLAETGPIDGKRGVVSLASLLKDIQVNSSFLTWENIQAINSRNSATIADFLCPGRKEKEFRELAGAGISLLIKGMQDKVNSAAAKINAISNKFIAHAATPQSVQSDPLSSEPIDIEEFWKCVETLARVARNIERYILARGVPLTAFQVENIFLIPGPTDTGGRLHQHLERQRCEVGSWGSDLLGSE